jgi:hypothetical protein
MLVAGMSMATTLALVELVALAGCSGRLPRPVDPTAPSTAERPPIVEQHTTGSAPNRPGTANAPVGAGALEREPTPAAGADAVKDPILEKIHEDLEEEAEEVRGQ